MSDYPLVCTVFAKEDFMTVGPRDPGDLGAELMAIARPNGRLQDHYRIAVGGNKRTEASFSTKDVFSSSLVPATMMKLQVRPS
jgi:hypothetical protein